MSQEFRVEREESKPTVPRSFRIKSHAADCKCLRCKLPPYANTSPNAELVTFREGDRELDLRVTTRRVGGGTIRIRQPEEPSADPDGSG
jgi:hypothetical protein